MAAQPPDLNITKGDLDRITSKLAAIPPGKTGALVVGVDWRAGVPVWGRFGVATRVGEHLQLSVEAETKFKQAPPNAGVYVAWVWVAILALFAGPACSVRSAHLERPVSHPLSSAAFGTIALTELALAPEQIIILSGPPKPVAASVGGGGDSTAPVVTAFTIPSTASSLTVSISSFTATDNTAVTGYLANESASTPSVSDPSWSGSAPSSYVFASQGAKTLYGWAKDAAGNISSGVSDDVTITLGGGVDDPNYRYVTDTGAGAKTGLSWSTACDGFTLSCKSTLGSGNSLTRGFTYYVADGDYRADVEAIYGHYFGKSVSGTTRITVKKATAADHGTNTGWSDEMGDGVATFDHITVDSGYWTFDGVVGSGTSGFGFKVDNQLCTAADHGATKTGIDLGNGNNVLRIKHMEIEMCGEDAKKDGTIALADCSASECGLSTDGIYFNSATTPSEDLEITDVYIHDLTRNGIALSRVDDVLIEGVTVARIHGFDDYVHGQAIQLTTPPMDNITIRNNTFVDISGSGAISWLYLNSSAGTCYTNHYVYGNVLYTTASTALGVNSRYYFSPGAFWLRDGSSSGSRNCIDVWKVYHNTYYNIVNPETSLSDVFTTFTNIEVRNNLFVNSTFQQNPANVGVTVSHNFFYNNTGANVPVGESNQQNGSGDPFVNAATFDLRLSGHTTAGFVLPSPYTTDRLGSTRSTPDRGAYEYTGGGNDDHQAARGAYARLFPLEARWQ